MIKVFLVIFGSSLVWLLLTLGMCALKYTSDEDFRSGGRFIRWGLAAAGMNDVLVSIGGPVVACLALLLTLLPHTTNWIMWLALALIMAVQIYAFIWAIGFANKLRELIWGAGMLFLPFIMTSRPTTFIGAKWLAGITTLVLMAAYCVVVGYRIVADARLADSTEEAGESEDYYYDDEYDECDESEEYDDADAEP